jgi:hypothetical protein
MECNSCFDNLIGLRDVCVPPDINSCRWINDIGINSEVIGSIITKDYSGPEDFFKKQYSLAVSDLVVAITNQYSARYIKNTILSGKSLGYNNTIKTIVPTTGKWCGITLELSNNNSFVDLYLSELILFTDFTGNIPVKAYDLDSGKLIGDFTVVSVAGQPSTLQVSKLFNSKRRNLNVFICYDSTGINSYKTTITQKNCCGSIGSFSSQYVYAYGAYSDTGGFTYDVIKKGATTFGMLLTYSVQCNHEQWLCSNLNLLSGALSYKLAANLMAFALSPGAQSQRVNTLVTINYDDIKTNFNFYQQKYVEEINTVFQNMQTPEDSKCFICKSYNKSVLSIPG